MRQLELFPPGTLDLDLLQLRSDCANDARSNLLTAWGARLASAALSARIDWIATGSLRLAGLHSV
jgi:hypothetical protein